MSTNTRLSDTITYFQQIFCNIQKKQTAQQLSRRCEREAHQVLSSLKKSDGLQGLNAASFIAIMLSTFCFQYSFYSTDHWVSHSSILRC